MKTTVIIGGVAGGMSAATRLRRLNEGMHIIVLEKGPYVSFANCGLPYHISGEIIDRDALILQTPSSLAARFQLDVRVDTEALSIDPLTKSVSVISNGVKSIINYDHLILSPGAKPFVPPIKGLDRIDYAYTLRNVPDMDKILAAIKNNKPQHAVVVGAGFIGIEMAEALTHLGVKVSVIEKATHVLPTMDLEMAALASEVLEANGVDLIMDDGVVEVEDHTITLESGATLNADLIILSVGVIPETAIAQTAGIELGMRGGILVDERYETSVADIYAVGDATLTKHTITQEPTLIALASPANRQGRQVADVISGQKRVNKGSLGTAIVRIFDTAIGSTGLTERQVQGLNYDYAAVHITANNHAGYFPGASPLILKMIFNKVDGTIYGAQVFGKDGVDKRLDVLSMAIKGNVSVHDLMEFESSYAPPFGSAKDPVNMLGYVASNIVEGVSENVQWHELASYKDKDVQLVDVSTVEEFSQASIKGFINIPLDDLRCKFNTLDINKEVIVSCRSGQRSYMAERILKQAGFKVKNLDGAIGIYRRGLPKEIQYA